MAEKQNFPQIPTTVWWGLRGLLRKSPNATIDESFLAINLNVQPAAARQYIVELRRVGLLADDGRSTPLAMKWRNDETYRDAANEIVQSVYPKALLDVAPPADAERAKVVSWFMHQGLGEGTARNKAATYLLIANDQIQDGAETRSTSVVRSAPAEKRIKRKEDIKPRSNEERPGGRSQRAEAMPLNINVQIHISADASGEQIEKIFSSMRRYLYDDAA